MFLISFLAITYILLFSVDKKDSLMLYVMLSNYLKFDLLKIILFCTLVILLVTFYMKRVARNVYLVNFACYRPGASLMCSKQQFMELSRRSGAFREESLAFQKKVLERSGLGEKPYFSEGLHRVPAEVSTMEAGKVMFGTLDELLSKVKNVKGKDIGIFVLNCSMFNPIPSLSSAIVNRYKLRSNILSYNLGGMGCSAGSISIDLAKRLLQLLANLIDRNQQRDSF